MVLHSLKKLKWNPRPQHQLGQANVYLQPARCHPWYRNRTQATVKAVLGISLRTLSLNPIRYLGTTWNSQNHKKITTLCRHSKLGFHRSQPFKTQRNRRWKRRLQQVGVQALPTPTIHRTTMRHRSKRISHPTSYTPISPPHRTQTPVLHRPSYKIPTHPTISPKTITSMEFRTNLKMPSTVSYIIHIAKPITDPLIHWLIRLHQCIYVTWGISVYWFDKFRLF